MTVLPAVAAGDWVAAAVIAILFVAALVRATIGFGDALIAMPILALLIGVQDAAVIVAIQQVVISASILVASWRAADFRAAGRLLIACALGIPLGIYALTALPESLVLALLGFVMIGFGLYALSMVTLPVLHDQRWSYPFGFVAGCLAGAYNTSGPPIVIYAALRRWSPAEFRATLHGFFLPAALLVAVGHGISGLWNRENMLLSLFALPALAIAAISGAWLSRRIDPLRFRRLVYYALVVLGVAVLIGAAGR